MIGKQITRDGLKYKISAYDEDKKLMLLEEVTDDENGDISCLFDAEYKEGTVSASKCESYFISKRSFFEQAEKSTDKCIESISSKIREKYYRISIPICNLIAKAYISET